MSPGPAQPRPSCTFTSLHGLEAGRDTQPQQPPRQPGHASAFAAAARSRKLHHSTCMYKRKLHTGLLRFRPFQASTMRRCHLLSVHIARMASCYRKHSNSCWAYVCPAVGAAPGPVCARKTHSQACERSWCCLLRPIQGAIAVTSQHHQCLLQDQLQLSLKAKVSAECCTILLLHTLSKHAHARARCCTMPHQTRQPHTCTTHTRTHTESTEG